MNISPFLAVFPNMDYISSPDSFFSTVKQQYPDYVQSGFFKKEQTAAMYIYQIQSKKHSFTGLISCVDVKDYMNRNIKKHEKTLAAKEQTQLQLLIRRNAVVKPILLTYPNINELDKWIAGFIGNKKVDFNICFEEEKQQHYFWAVQKPEDVSFLQKLFLKKIPVSYIADGHHRSSATSLLHQRSLHNPDIASHDKILCAFFPTSELEVHDFNRVIHNLDDISMAMFMAKLSQVFDIEPINIGEKPTQKHELTMYLHKEWFRLNWRKKTLESYRTESLILDVTLLNEKVLHDILEVKDVRTDPRIEYIEGPKGIKAVVKKVNADSHSVGFFLYPPSLEELMHISDKNEVLPPKSTWFEPRMKNGVIVKEY